MGRIFDPTVALQYLNKGSAIITSVPVTMACWLWVDAGASSGVFLGIGDTASSGAPCLHLIYDSGDNTLRAEYAGTVDDATAKTALSTNTIVHGAAVFASATSRSVYLNGVKVSSAVTVNPTGTINGTRIGNMALALTSFGLKGRVLFPAFWNVALGDTEISSLAKGAGPKLIRPSALKSYLRMSGGASPEPDFMGGSWPLVSTPGVTANAVPLFGP